MSRIAASRGAQRTRRGGAARPRPAAAHPADPLWYKQAIIYELHVRAFADSNGDGIGDFPGLTGRLDYLQDLGVTAVWLLPFYPSPLRDDGYDIADYTSVNPAYGTLKDFKRFVDEAHARGIRVITELVINHTSEQHPWFQRARRSAPGSKWRDFYVWTDDPGRYSGTRIIFQDFETSNWTWDRVAKAYYWHRFYAHQPDLNFDNPDVHRAIEEVADRWFDLGVDGMRLDAIPYLYEREGTNCENLPETHAYLKSLRRHVDERYPDRMLLAEANQWPEDAVAYFGEGDECHMCFHFPLMPRLFMAIRMEDRFPVIDILQETPPLPPGCQWAIFLRNHDELTLEMVTDEERDYMYRAYALDRQARINLGIRRRLAPLLGNNRRKIELMNGLLLSLPGTPVVYYGDEIGMGDNVYLGDRNGVRTPMQWSGDRNAGFSRANPQRLFLPVIIDPEYHYETLNVEAQQSNPSSLLWWMKRLIALRKRHRVFGSGGIRFLHPSNPKVLAYLREHTAEHEAERIASNGEHGAGGETILVVANLSRFVQCVELDLSGFQGSRPVELFGATRLPPIGESPYFLTLGPHSFFWFSLERTAAEGAHEAAAAPAVPTVTLDPNPEQPLRTRTARSSLESVLAADLPRRRWFGSKARSLRTVRITEVVPVRTAAPERELTAMLVMARIEYADAEPEMYALPLALASAERADRVAAARPASVVAEARLRGREGRMVLYDAMSDPDFAAALLEVIARRRRLRGASGEVVGAPARGFRRVTDAERPAPTLSSAEQSNSSVVFGDRYILKLYRRVEAGVNPDLEIGRYLSDRRFPHASPLAGWIEYASEDGEAMTLAMLQDFVPNLGDAWQYTLDLLGPYFERAIARRGAGATGPGVPGESPLALAHRPTPREAADLIGPYLQSAELLGRRTAEMHLALASAGDDPAFATEPFGQLYQRSLYQSMRNAVRRSLDLLRKRFAGADQEALHAEAQALAAREGEIIARLRQITGRRLGGLRTRCHGDYHLGQVLYTGKDFVIIDFEGEPARTLGERRLRRSPLRDVAGMLRSFDYAAHAALLRQVELGSIGETDAGAMEPWAEFWSGWSGATFLRGYFDAAGDAPFLSADPEDTRVLLGAWLIEKAAYELAYEMNNRPGWLGIPLRGMRRLLDHGT